MSRYSRVLSVLLNDVWLIAPGNLPIFYELVKSHDLMKLDPSALKSYPPDLRKTFHSEVYGNVGVLNLMGPLIPYADMFSEMCGATSLTKLSKEFRAFEDNDSIDTILHYVDSPGGYTTMTNEYAKMVRDSSKPTVAYVSGTAASAAYWIASAHDKIYIDDTARLGSIGTVVAFPAPDDSVIELVSTQSPNKRPDVMTDEGKAVIIKELDELAEIFIEAVAANRGVSFEHVKDKFGKGGVLVGQSAVDVGMADDIMTFEEVLAKISDVDDSHVTAITSVSRKEENIMDVKTLKAEHPDVYKDIFNAGVASAKEFFLKDQDELAASYQEKISSYEKRIASLEKSEALRVVEFRTVEANVIVADVLSEVPSEFHEKVRNAVSSHVREYVAEAIDADKLHEYVSEEVTSWKDIFDRVQSADIVGVGGVVKDAVTGDVNADADVDAVVSRLLSHIEQEVK